MKRLVFKKWVGVVLAIINTIAFMVIASECDDIKTRLISGLIAFLIIAISIKLVNKYGRKEWL